MECHRERDPPTSQTPLLNEQTLYGCPDLAWFISSANRISRPVLGHQPGTERSQLGIPLQ
jgi:hypothetical protein